MSQITWRNVNSGGNSAAAKRGQVNGVETILGAFDPLEKILKDRVTIDEQNWDAQAAQNTRDVKARLQNIGNLGELNQMQNDGLISESAFNKQFGAQYDPSVVQATTDARRQALQQAALNEAMPAALALADEKQDLGAATSILEKQLAASGMQAPKIRESINNFITNNVAREKQYAQANKNDAEAFLATAPSPENPQQAEALVAQAHTAGIKNTDYIRSRVGEELDNHYMHGKYQWEAARHGREATIFAQGQRDRRDADAAGTAAFSLMREGLNAKETFARIKGSVRGALQPQLLRNLTSMEADLSGLSKDQKTELDRVSNKGLKKITQYQAEVDTENNNYITKRNDLTGITPAVLDVVDSAVKDSGGIVGKILSSTTDKGGSEVSDIFPGVDLGSNGIENQLNSFRDEITTTFSDISPKEVDALLWLSYQDSDKISRMGNKGMNPTSMRTALQKRLSQFKKGQAVEQERLQFQQAAKKDIESLQDNLLDFTYANTKAVETKNRTGKEGNVVEFLRGLDNKVLDIDEDYGVIGQLKKQRKEVADTKAAKEAVDKLNKRRKKFSRSAEEYPGNNKPVNTEPVKTDSQLLRDRIIQEQSGSYYKQPEPEVKEIRFRKRPQN